MSDVGGESITVFLADDNVIVREGVRALLGVEHRSGARQAATPTGCPSTI